MSMQKRPPRPQDVKTKISCTTKARWADALYKATTSENIRMARRHAVWEQFDELEELWVKLDRPGCTKFKRLVIERGYPDVSYQSMILHFTK